MTRHTDSLEHYDCTILGTGIKESILAGLLSARGLKVLQMDDASSYGSSSRTLRYDEFLQEMTTRSQDPQFFDALGPVGVSFYIDLTPKIFLADEGLIKVIAEHNLGHCIEFNVIEEQYIVTNGKTILIPTTKTAALKSNLCGPIQLLRLHRFVGMIKGFYEASESERVKIASKWATVRDLYTDYGISTSIQVILGHGVALYTSEAYLEDRPGEFILRLTTYFRSVARANPARTGGNSPFLYPKYGISEISQGFARLAAVRGGTTRMTTEILDLKECPAGYHLSLRTEGQEDQITTAQVIANDRYYSALPNTYLKEVHTLRGVYILKSSNQTTRQALITAEPSDLFLLVVGASEGVAPEGYAIGYLTAAVPEESFAHLNPADLAQRVTPGTSLLQAWRYEILQSFLWVDTATEGRSGLHPYIHPLHPMDNTVDFRTVYHEVQSVLSHHPSK
ncbi:Rab GDP dissociation inhibitor [Nematocida homosporus]|uniref:Rab GDP dissociation inhibitor n=1 Tax=Nematocida homosporus TaxID=1912981 RepID=UPI00221F0C98|nr:Rab GDP dissociation inhibitor [Nematocida homosporus]KAI5184748.1 Rab GDP dissociation inhibitor [Nematocida homosporus]